MRRNRSTVIVESILIRRSPNASVVSPVHASGPAYGAAVAGVARQMAYDPILIAERVRHDVHSMAEQPAEGLARPAEIDGGLLAGNASQRNVEIAV